MLIAALLRVLQAETTTAQDLQPTMALNLTIMMFFQLTKNHAVHQHQHKQLPARELVVLSDA